MRESDRSPPPSSAITSVAINHVLLSYSYLDEGDLDGYASLLDEDVRLRRPDRLKAYGRAEAVGLMASIAGPPGRHRLHKVIGSGSCVATVGRCTGPAAFRSEDTFIGVDFVDIFTVSPEGLLLDHRRYYDTSSI